MNKLSSVALSAALVAAGLGASVSAEARPYVGVDIGYPQGMLIEPVDYGHRYFRPYFDSHGRYWHREFERHRYDRFHHERWDRR